MASNKNKCSTKFCRNTTAGKFCSSCRSRQSRQRDPLKYSYHTNKNNAKRRRKAWELTLQEFAEFCREFNYLAGKGRSRTSFTVDRIRNEEGYHAGNIQVLQNHENSRKGSKVLVYDWRTRQATVLDTINRYTEEQKKDLPF